MSALSVTVDQKSGFCFGVLFAVQMAEKVLATEDKLYCLGQIVHNDKEVQRLEEKGLQIIDHSELKHIKDAKVLIRAHGEPPSTYKIAFENNIELLDASCPVVLNLQHSVQQAHADDEKVYIYGTAGHPEIIALLGQLKQDAVVFFSTDELDLETLPRRISLYSQTTKAVPAFKAIIQELQAAGIDVQVRDTICRQVSNRERDVQRFARQHDKVVFVSGTRSSNGKALYGTCKKTNPHTYFVSQVEDIRSEWFTAGDTIGVCGATSTPPWLMKAVREHILSLSLDG